MSSRNPAVRRILADVKELRRNPSPMFVASPLEDNLFEWHFTIRGLPDTAFSGGIYHGRIILPPEYPLKPPSIVFLTRNGRFQTKTRICLSISAYHPEEWQPAWGIRTILEAIVSFFPTEGEGAIGSLDEDDEERKRLAQESHHFRCPICGPVTEALKPMGAEELRRAVGVNARPAPAIRPGAAPSSSSPASSPAPAPAPAPAKAASPTHAARRPRHTTPTPASAPRPGRGPQRAEAAEGAYKTRRSRVAALRQQLQAARQELAHLVALRRAARAHPPSAWQGAYASGPTHAMAAAAGLFRGHGAPFPHFASMPPPPHYAGPILRPPLGRWQAIAGGPPLDGRGEARDAPGPRARGEGEGEAARGGGRQGQAVERRRQHGAAADLEPNGVDSALHILAKLFALLLAALLVRRFVD